MKFLVVFAESRACLPLYGNRSMAAFTFGDYRKLLRWKGRRVQRARELRLLNTLHYKKKQTKVAAAVASLLFKLQVA